MHGPYSALDAVGPAARDIEALWWVMLVGAALITALVGGLLFYAWTQRHAARQVSQRLWIVTGGLLFPLATLSVLLLFGLWTGERLLPHAREGVVTVEARGHQWWWEFTYRDASGRRLHTASELRIPAGRPIDVLVTSEDVIHSFWVPRLAGKLDGIPGHLSRLRIEAPAPGRYYGLCAEFCGIGHARNHFSVVAQEPAAFDAWLARLGAVRAPVDPAFARSCGTCHAVEAEVRSPAPNLALFGHREWPLVHPLTDPSFAARRAWLRDHGGQTATSADLDHLMNYLGSLR